MGVRSATVPTSSEAHASKALHAALWVTQILLAIAFGLSGFYKAREPLDLLAQNMPWVASVPPFVVRLAGGSEVLGALGLLLPSVTRVMPKLSALAAAGLVLVMVLAAGLHLSRGEYGGVAINAVLGGLAAFVAWGRYRAAPIPSRRQEERRERFPNDS